MASTTAQPSLAGGPGASTRWKQFSDFVVRRRVSISLFGFIVLIAQDILSGTKPHSLTNLGEPHAGWGLVLVAAGLGIRSWAAGTLHKWSELATTGPYAVVRHPLYVGSFLMMIGFCTIIGDRENFLFVVGPVLAIYVVTVFHEERGLAQLYPTHWSGFAERVPRFLPRRLPAQPFAAWSGRQWRVNREYQAVLASLAGLVALHLWRLA